MDERDGSGDAPAAAATPQAGANGRAAGREPARDQAVRASSVSTSTIADGGGTNGTGNSRRRGFHRSRAKGRPPARAANLRSLVGLVGKLPIDGRDTADRKRRLVAELCKVVGAHLSGTENVGEELTLPKRLRQTLQGLIKGDSEKQIAFGLGISQHTVHVYVKQLYKRLRVSSRGELMAKFMRGK